MFLLDIIEKVLHLDKFIYSLIESYGLLVYLILFLIIFLETGLVATPFLPGDSLLFVVGTLAGTGALELLPIIILLLIAAILGDSVNYLIGSFFGKKWKDSGKFFNIKYYEKAKKFYDNHGGKTIIIARFIPIVRTFAPFIAGISSMNYRKFFIFNVFGAILWILLFVLAGFFFGNIPLVRDNLTIVIIIIVALSFIPAIIEWIRTRS